MSNLTAYKNIRGILKTGDLVLFSGKTRNSSIIKFFSNSKWSHVAIVVKVDDLDMLLLWESTTLADLPDALDDIPKRGVQTVLLSERLERYDGEISIRRLSKPVTATMKSELVKLRSEIKNKPYEESKWELAKSLLDFSWLDPNIEDFSSVFCSELVAEALQRMKLISNILPANEFTPRDFACNGIFEHYLQGCTYGPEIQIK